MYMIIIIIVIILLLIIIIIIIIIIMIINIMFINLMFIMFIISAAGVARRVHRPAVGLREGRMRGCVCDLII